jgi:hypothetical protein
MAENLCVKLLYMLRVGDSVSNTVLYVCPGK